MKTVSAFIEQAKQELQHLYDDSELQLIAFFLLEDVMGFSRTDLQLRSNQDLDQKSLERLNDFVLQLKAGRPLQYVLGYAWFSGMKFIVNENVLIPRPETEELVEWIISHHENLNGFRARNSILNSHISAMDIGTGSGCIAVSIKKALPAATVHGIDISEEALLVAKQNAEANAAAVNFFQDDILSMDFQNSTGEKFDIIVSNPPYIRKSEMNSMAPQVKDHEPHTALFVQDEDPLIFYIAIADFAKTHLKENGQLFFEINATLGTEVRDLLLKKGFLNVELKKDISGNFRMVRAVPNHLTT
ncbi:MAG: peptide chain release factor N(5)-glutamine methyltransferase [Bacteroidetes bacterium]|nr:peptide chain release factor N(5)-glutamine methyltransferase [Bacteroidota bacterium]